MHYIKYVTEEVYMIKSSVEFHSMHSEDCHVEHVGYDDIAEKDLSK